MELYTPRLLVRDVTLDDFPDVHAYGSDEQTVRFMDWGPNTPDETTAFLRRKLAAQQAVRRREYDLAVVLRETSRVIGGVRISLDPARTATADIGYVFNPRFWDRGYATETARSLLAFGFGDLSVHRIYARVMEKIGMQYEGRLRHHLLLKGHWRDSLLYAILASDSRP